MVDNVQNCALEFIIFKYFKYEVFKLIPYLCISIKQAWKYRENIFCWQPNHLKYISFLKLVSVFKVSKYNLSLLRHNARTNEIRYIHSLEENNDNNIFKINTVVAWWEKLI
jgi:hypothetical protein